MCSLIIFRFATCRWDDAQCKVWQKLRCTMYNAITLNVCNLQTHRAAQGKTFRTTQACHVTDTKHMHNCRLGRLPRERPVSSSSTACWQFLSKLAGILALGSDRRKDLCYEEFQYAVCVAHGNVQVVDLGTEQVCFRTHMSGGCHLGSQSMESNRFYQHTARQKYQVDETNVNWIRSAYVDMTTGVLPVRWSERIY